MAIPGKSDDPRPRQAQLQRDERWWRRPRAPHERSLLWRILQSLCRILATVLFDFRAQGRENVPTRGGALLVANHQSYLDPVLLGVPLRRPISYMARSGLFTIPGFNWLIRSLHAFPVRQGEGDVGAIKETLRRLKEGHLLNIYPEGARTKDGDIGIIQPGIGLVVRRAGVPVIPVVIDGSFAAWPFNRRLFRPHPIRLVYGRPLDLSGLKAGEVVQLLDQTLRRMLEELRGR